jgi:hypothetical protein
MRPMIRRPQDNRLIPFLGQRKFDAPKERSIMLRSSASIWLLSSDAASWAHNSLSSGISDLRPVSTTAWDTL